MLFAFAVWRAVYRKRRKEKLLSDVWRARARAGGRAGDMESVFRSARQAHIEYQYSCVITLPPPARLLIPISCFTPARCPPTASSPAPRTPLPPHLLLAHHRHATFTLAKRKSGRRQNDKPAFCRCFVVYERHLFLVRCGRRSALPAYAP